MDPEALCALLDRLEDNKRILSRATRSPIGTIDHAQVSQASSEYTRDIGALTKLSISELQDYHAHAQDRIRELTEKYNSLCEDLRCTEREKNRLLVDGLMP